MEEKNTIDLINETSNSFYRLSDDMSSDGYIYDTQIDTAKKVVASLADMKTRRNHVILVAKMQSGKTGVCNAVTNIITQSTLQKELAIHKVFFITGMNDCGLKEQTYFRIMTQVIGANSDNVFNGKKYKGNIKDKKFFILKNSDFKKYDGDLDNSILFIDESHYGSNENHKLTQFFEKNNIDWRNKNSLIERNIYIVSVSATPFSEMVSDVLDCKSIITLDTDEGYMGVSEFLKDDSVLDANKDDITIDGNIFDYIESAHERMLKNDENGVIIIRTRNFDVIESNPYVRTHFNVYKMYSNGSKIEYNKLSNEILSMMRRDERIKAIKGKKRLNPELLARLEGKPLLVLIKGAYRAGITIPDVLKPKIYMVYDYSLKCDTTAQALLGRMCGYRDTSKNNTVFYLNKKFADMYGEWEHDFKDKSNIPSNKSSYEWCEYIDVEKDDELPNSCIFSSRPCGNFTMDLDDNEIIELYEVSKKQDERRKIALDMFKKLLLKNNIQCNYDYLHEILLKGKNNYALSSQRMRFDSFSDDSLVFQFRPTKMNDFMNDTSRDYLTKDDIGKSCISLVMDATIEKVNGEYVIGGNKRLLVYHVEVGVKQLVPSWRDMYQTIKDTSL